MPHTNRERKLSADPDRLPTGAKNRGPGFVKSLNQDRADPTANSYPEGLCERVPKGFLTGITGNTPHMDSYLR